jgi:HPt (histidine-containing phosphotransfer) domain-containing protein
MNNGQGTLYSSFFIHQSSVSGETQPSLSFSPEQPIYGYMGNANSRTASSQTGSAVINLEVLDNIRLLQGQDSPALLKTIIYTYLGHAPQLLAALHDAGVRSDALSLQRAAHSLKSSSIALGATTLAALCQDLELMGRQQNLANVTTVLAAVTAEYDLVREALLGELQRET